MARTETGLNDTGAEGGGGRKMTFAVQGRVNMKYDPSWVVMKGMGHVSDVFQLPMVMIPLT